MNKPSAEIRVLVNLDEEMGRQPRVSKTGETRADQHRVVIKCSKVVPFDSLRAYFTRKASFNDSCLEAISKSVNVVTVSIANNILRFLGSPHA